MGASDHLERYAEGWTKGDAATILAAAAGDFVFDDPNAGRIAKADFAAYLEGLKAAVEGAQGGARFENFMDLSEVVASADGDTMTAWCWWAIPGTGIAGSGLIKVDDTGVRSERITYYAKPAG